MRATGARRRAFRSRGVFAYRVVARRMAPTLSWKSTTKAIGEYVLKNDCRDCNADQRITAAFSLIRKVRAGKGETYWGNGSNIIDLSDFSPRQIRHKVLFQTLVACGYCCFSCPRHGDR